jgi:transcriptional regulator GlxA family with amidase domain
MIAAPYAGIRCGPVWVGGAHISSPLSADALSPSVNESRLSDACPKRRIKVVLGHLVVEAPMQRIGFVVSPGFQVVHFAALSVFECANDEIREPVYDVRLLSETGGSICSSIGVSIATEPFDSTNFDTLIVACGAEPSTPGLIEFVRQAPGRCRRVAATCTGAFILAEAGLLDGRRATTHWRRARDLQARFPKVKVEEDRIFISDGPVWTSAGIQNVP